MEVFPAHLDRKFVKNHLNYYNLWVPYFGPYFGAYFGLKTVVKISPQRCYNRCELCLQLWLNVVVRLFEEVVNIVEDTSCFRVW